VIRRPPTLFFIVTGAWLASTAVVLGLVYLQFASYFNAVCPPGADAKRGDPLGPPRRCLRLRRVGRASSPSTNIVGQDARPTRPRQLYLRP